MKTMLKLLVVAITMVAFVGATGNFAAWAADDKAPLAEKGDPEKNTNKKTDNKNTNTNKKTDNKNTNTNKKTDNKNTNTNKKTNE